MYDKFMETTEHMVRRCNTGAAPIAIVEGLDPYYRSLKVGAIVRDVVRKKLQAIHVEDKLQTELATAPESNGGGDELIETLSAPEGDKGEIGANDEEPVLTVLSKLDMDKQLSKKDYSQKLKKHQAKLNLLHQKAREQGVSTLLVFEGWDAAGKGGAIRRITQALEARNCRVRPFSAPNDEERAHHYLWRFWRHLSRAGRFTIYDRSWYGRVLVERVEGFATEAEWRRAYAEINEFESELIEHGIVLIKFWLHITKQEQFIRFKEREQIPYKRWKLTNEDWRNREKWDQYELAVNDMVQCTSTRKAPWILVEGNDKRYARVKVIGTVCDKLEQALGKD
jgi:polyphosphate kinase 2 (PPK2 family)